MTVPAADLETGRSEYAQVRILKEQPTALSQLDLKAAWVPFLQTRSLRHKEETPASYFSFSFEARSLGTSTACDVRREDWDEEPVFIPATDTEPEGEPARGSSEREASVRLELLARKSASALSPEDDARLRVATERLRKLLPRVTAADFEALATAAEKVKSIGDETAALRAELGL